MRHRGFLARLLALAGVGRWPWWPATPGAPPPNLAAGADEMVGLIRLSDYAVQIEIDWDEMEAAAPLPPALVAAMVAAMQARLLNGLFHVEP